MQCAQGACIGGQAALPHVCAGCDAVPVVFVHHDAVWLSSPSPFRASADDVLGHHTDGAVVRLPLVRLTAADGATGVGPGRPRPALADALIGQRVRDLFAPDRGVGARWRRVEAAVWDLVGQQLGQPVYTLAAAITGRAVPQPYRVACYDTSLYIDDLHLGDARMAAALLAAEVREGYAGAPCLQGQGQGRAGGAPPAA